MQNLTLHLFLWKMESRKKKFGQLDEAGVSSLFPGKGHLKKFKAFFTNFEKEIQSCYQQETSVV